MNDNSEHIVPIELLTRYFSGEATTEERIKAESWRDNSAENKKEFEAIEKLWNMTGLASEKDDFNIDSEWRYLEKRIGLIKGNQFGFKQILQIAASVILISVLSFLGYKQLNITTEKTPVAKTEDVVLPDGSKLSLNANSKIAYSKGFGIKHRNIRLSGEAYFKVTSNEDLPFIIQANEASIKVIGTEFNVKAYKKRQKIKVTVTEGTVSLFETKKPQKESLINKGETGTFDRKAKVINKIPGQDINDIAWKTLHMRFDNTPLSNVVEILSNTYHIDIMAEPSIKDCTITVDFENENLGSIFNVLKSTLNLNISKRKDQFIISGKGC